MTEFALSKNLDLKFDDTVSRLPDALASEGFGVLTQIDVQSVFAQKINQPFRRYRIFGACNPKLAHHALTSNLLAGIMIPCNVILWERDDGTTTIAAVDPVQTRPQRLIRPLPIWRRTYLLGSSEYSSYSTEPGDSFGLLQVVRIDLGVVEMSLLLLHASRSRVRLPKPCDRSCDCLLYTSPSPRDRTRPRMPSS